MMHLCRILKLIRSTMRGTSGMAFIETLVALVVLGAVSVAFLSGLATTSRASMIVDEQTTAESLVRSQMEWVKKISYTYEATEYSPQPISSSDDYIGYSASIAAERLHVPDDGIQKVTVTITHYNKEVIELVGYKVDR